MPILQPRPAADADAADFSALTPEQKAAALAALGRAMRFASIYPHLSAVAHHLEQAAREMELGLAEATSANAACRALGVPSLEGDDVEGVPSETIGWLKEAIDSSRRHVERALAPLSAAVGHRVEALRSPAAVRPRVHEAALLNGLRTAGLARHAKKILRLLDGEKRTEAQRAAQWKAIDERERADRKASSVYRGAIERDVRAKYDELRATMLSDLPESKRETVLDLIAKAEESALEVHLGGAEMPQIPPA